MPCPRAPRYEVRVPKEEADLVGDLRYSWRKAKKQAADVTDALATLQVLCRWVAGGGRGGGGGGGGGHDWASG